MLNSQRQGGITHELIAEPLCKARKALLGMRNTESFFLITSELSDLMLIIVSRIGIDAMGNSEPSGTQVAARYSSGTK